MPLDLIRIDDRLVHGQVVVAWGSYLDTTKIILSSNEIAESENEIELFKQTVEFAPRPLKVCVLTLQGTVNILHNELVKKEKIILLVESPQDVLDLIHAGMEITKVNVGGMHYEFGKTKLASYIYVDDEDILCFKKLSALGIQLEGKNVPTAKAIDINKMLEDGRF